MSGGKGGGSTVVGYWYGLGLHMVLCHGPVDAVTEIRVGDRTAWTGNQTGNGNIAIVNRNLFGGEEREGGLDGSLDVMMGAATQTPNAYLQSQLGTDIPAFRGVLSVAWRGLVSALNPYIKPWRFRVKRIPRAWYPAKAEINGDANPAHIVRECLTHADWGMGYPEADMDDVAFAAAADTLFAEGFGLSILWSQEQTIEAFILSIMQHVDGMLYADTRTGKFTFKLARDDYIAANLMVLSPANIARMEEFTRPSWGDITNQVTVQYRDGATDKDASFTVHDVAAIQVQGGVVSSTVQYPGISNAALANRVAIRDLKQLSNALAKCTIVGNRQASALEIGGAFKLTWPAYGVTDLVMRVARISYGDLINGQIRIEAVQDIFGLPNAIYATPPATGWQDPISLPAPCPAQALYEVPYWQIVKDVVGEVPSLLADIHATDGMVAALGARPSGDAIDYHAFTWDVATASWADRQRGSFAPTAIVDMVMPLSASAITLPLVSVLDIDYVTVGELAIVDNEWLLVTAINLTLNTVTVQRGVLDSVPVVHGSGARIWFAVPHFIKPAYVTGESAQIRIAPKTGKGELAVMLAGTLTTTLQGRFIRPYPPGNIRLNGAAYPLAVAGDLSIGWANRNRINQTASVILQSAGNITEEAGQTTIIRLYDQANALRHTYSGLVGTTQAWTLAQISADGAALSNSLRLEMETSRTDASGTFISLQKHSITVDRAGYGLNYGNYYGGV